MNRASKLCAVVAAGLVLWGCGEDDDSSGDSEQAGAGEGPVCREVSDPGGKELNLKKPQAQQPTAGEIVFETSCGRFVVALDAENNPKTAASLEYLAERGAFENTTFHRVVPGFVVQGGDPAGDGTGGPGYSVDEKPPLSTAYTRGTVAMAKTAAEPPGRSGSQFFVVTGADAGLPPDFAVAGEIATGFEVIEAIEALGDPTTELPSRPVVIESATPR